MGMMGKGPDTFEYFFLISNIYILLVFYFHFYKNRHWFLRTYIIGKSLQLVGILLMEFNRYMSFFPHWGFTDVLIIACFPFEVFGMISYDGVFNKKIFRNFLIVTIGLCLVHVIMIMQHIRSEIISISSIFFYNYGAAILLRKKDKSRFRYLIGVVFIAYSLIMGVLTIITITKSGFQPIPDLMQLPMQGSMQGMMPPRDSIREFLDNLLFFVTLVSSIGYLVVLKEQDEIALDKVNEQINKENLTLKKLDEEKNTFFSIISHDLKGPIGNLEQLSEMLIKSKNKQDWSAQEKWINLIHLTSAKTYNTLNDLLLWARSESGILVPQPEIIKLNELMDEVIYLFQAAAMNKNIQLIANCADDIKVFADKEMINTVVRNILSNAIKFTDKNGSVWIQVKQDKDIIISITDTGVGISNDVINNLFSLDSKYSTRGTNREEGTGLGLKLTHEFVVKNNGKIWVESTEGKGSTFYISLPAS